MFYLYITVRGVSRLSSVVLGNGSLLKVLACIFVMFW